MSIAVGRVFGAWVDLREGPGFGAVFTAELDPSRAIFVPRGVGNAFQTLEDGTGYTYLVNDHWSSDARYTHVNLADPDLKIPWPIPLRQAELSEKDRSHPHLGALDPVPRRKTLILGAGGTLGRALRGRFGSAAHLEYATRSDLDLLASTTESGQTSAGGLRRSRRWRDYDTIINAAAYTAVDAAETPEGRRAAWAINATVVGQLAQIAADHQITLVHVSSDYVFDGASPAPYSEEDHVCPLSVYGHSKAAGDLAVTTAPRHYILRTSWVVGRGENFVSTMARLATSGVAPRVVDDQVGRLTFADDLAEAIEHVLRLPAPYGTYNLTGAGPATSWADIAREVFRLCGADPARVAGVTTAEYLAGGGAPRTYAQRPANSVLDLAKITAAGFTPQSAMLDLANYLNTGETCPSGSEEGRNATR